ncbi:hypothetical protein EUA93_04675 [Nocardioides oleivorans]|uniref:Uncharacterized protein n=1 Tax=Nocardioides oleivorans TaxID=273676 RepID=A0A4V1RKW6_9ACTN|nr:hypothetical protein [Nocardioides oleivorans]RYB93712.1 hypothetical protein EUA93_04675 [Nocardioides oleivorans]
MASIDVDFCFYDDPDFRSDADSDSAILQHWHALLWSKDLPDGRMIEWTEELETTCLTHDSPLGTFRVSSDTIASLHERYVPLLWAGLGPKDQETYMRAFYTIGGFNIFPRHPQSLNQQRGWERAISDRFDLTLECIRRHYLDLVPNPLAAVLTADREFFRLFGVGQEGFEAYVEFFHFQDLVVGNNIKWFDESAETEWSFSSAALPGNDHAYRRHLDNVLAFVTARNQRIARWASLQ